MIRLLSLLTFILISGFPASPQTPRFSAGVAQADITPPPGVELWGYTNRSGPAESTLDPLIARILVIDDGKTSAALVTLDLGRTFGPAQIDRLRERVSRDYHVNEVMLIASHTHSGPAIEDGYDDGKLPEWEASALDLIARAIGDARARMEPARIGVGMGQAIIGHNRRLVQSDGSVKMLWRNSTGQQTGMIDPVVGVIRIDDANGRPKASWSITHVIPSSSARTTCAIPPTSPERWQNGSRRASTAARSRSSFRALPATSIP
ncbi:MAG: neutral/alkaline non-lysosomal ceramidase N-terminal domain-containing protein [Blastocatellales bacterium]